MKLCERMPAKLHTHGEQPYRQGKPHGADWDSRSQTCTDHATEDSADDEVDEQIGIETCAVKMERAADDGEAKAKSQIGADDAANVERSEAEEGEAS